MVVTRVSIKDTITDGQLRRTLKIRPAFQSTVVLL